MAAAGPGAVFLHCLPAHRGEEVAAEVIDGPASLVWAQAANRMHAVRSLFASLDTAPPVPGGRHGSR
jgi:ornithine carbamoyltransferase